MYQGSSLSSSTSIQTVDPLTSSIFLSTGTSLDIKQEPKSTFDAAARKRKYFVEVLKKEFLREWYNIWEIACGRASPRETLTKKIISPLTDLTTAIPTVGSLVKGFTRAVEFAYNYQRNASTEVIASKLSQYEPDKLEILIDNVAREVLHLYEPFIIKLVDDLDLGVIPFAKVGALRMIQYIISQVKATADGRDFILEINELSLLIGLIEGQSGAAIDGFFNHSLQLKQRQSTILGSKPRSISAEDVYARSALRFLMLNGTLLVDQVYVRDKPKHYELREWKSLPGTLITRLKVGNDFGYSKFRRKKGHTHDPCTIVIMPLPIIERYNFQEQDQKLFSNDLRAELQMLTFSAVRVNRVTVEQYLVWRKIIANQQKSLINYVRVLVNNSAINTVICNEDLSSLQLAGADLSNTDLSRAVLTGNLDTVNFSDSYLRATVFKNVSSAHHIRLQGAHCEYLQASGVNFGGSNFVQTDFSYANLENSNFIGCKMLGTIWTNAKLDRVVTDSTLISEQKRQTENLKREVKLQQKQLQELTALVHQQYDSSSVIQSQHQIYIHDRGNEVLLKCSKELDSEFEKLSKIVHAETSSHLEILKSQWQDLVKQVPEKGITNLLAMSDYLETVKKNKENQLDLQPLVEAWEKCLFWVMQYKDAADKITSHFQNLQLRFQSRLVYEFQCQQDLQQLNNRMINTNDPSILQNIKDKLPSVEDELKKIRSNSHWRAILKDFKENLVTQYKVFGDQLENKFYILGEQLCADFDAHFETQLKRLVSIEEQLKNLEKKILERIEKLEKRVDTLEIWVTKVQQDLLTQQLEKEEAKKLSQEVIFSLQSLQKQLQAQQKQQLKQEEKLVALQHDIFTASSSEHIENIKKDLADLEKSTLTVGIIKQKPEAIPDNLVKFKAELVRQKNLLEKASVTPLLKNKIEPKLKILSAQKQQLEQFEEAFNVQWKLHCLQQQKNQKKIEDQLSAAYISCDQRLKVLETEVNKLKLWAKNTTDQISSLESEEEKTQTQLSVLQEKLLHWITQQEEYEKELNSIKLALQDKKNSPDAKQVGNLKQRLKILQSQGKVGNEDLYNKFNQSKNIFKIQQDDISNALEIADEDLNKEMLIVVNELGKKIQIIENIEKQFSEKEKMLLEKTESDIQTLEKNLEALTKRVKVVEDEVDFAHQRIDLTQQLIHSKNPLVTLGARLLELRKKIIEDDGLTNELSHYVAPNGQAYESDYSEPLFPWVKKNFLQQPKARILVIKGPGGGGKTTFNRYLYRQLWLDPIWNEFKPGDIPGSLICFFIPLGSPRVNPRRLLDFLRDLPELDAGFTSDEIDQLKSFHLLLITDAYDEMPENLRVNLFVANGLDNKNINTKLLVSCRMDVLNSVEEARYFMPGKIDESNLYQSYYIAPFSDSQISDYISQYLSVKISAPTELVLWRDTGTYRDYFKKIKGIEELISIPFLLMITVERLPSIVKEVEQEQKNSITGKIELTQKKLLESFVKGWFERQVKDKALPKRDFLKNPTALLGEKRVKEIVGTADLTVDTQMVFLETACWLYCQKLAKNLQKEKRFSVIFPPLEEKITSLLGDEEEIKTRTIDSKATWIKTLFDPSNSDMACCQRHSPLRQTQVGHGRNEYSFLHALLRDYFATVLIEQQARIPTLTPLTLPQFSEGLALTPGQALLTGLTNTVLGHSQVRKNSKPSTDQLELEKTQTSHTQADSHDLVFLQ